MRRTLALLFLIAGVAGVGPAGAQAPSGTFDGWRVQVSVSPSRFGPIGVSTSALRRVRPNNARPWLTHDLRFSNLGAKVVRFEDTRRSTFLGGKRLLAADHGCGYEKLERAPWTEAGACLLYLDALTVRSGRSQTRDVTIFRGLRGMERLRPGRYVFAKTMRFRVGSGPRQTAMLRVVYAIS